MTISTIIFQLYNSWQSTAPLTFLILPNLFQEYKQEYSILYVRTGQFNSRLMKRVSLHEIQNQTVVAGFICHVIVQHLTVTQIDSIHCHFLIHPCLYALISEMKHFEGIILKELNPITNAFLSYFPFRTLCACVCMCVIRSRCVSDLGG